MEDLFNSLKKLISPDLISKFSSVLGEDNSKVSTAVNKIVPSMLGGLLEKGHGNQLESILQKAGDANIVSNNSGIYAGTPDAKAERIGSDFLTSLFGTKVGAFNSLISTESGLSTSGVGKLLTMVAPLVAGFLGNKLNSGMTYSELLNKLNSEKSNFLPAIPAGLAGILGVSSVNALGNSYFHSGQSKINNGENNTYKKMEEPKNSSWGWLKWALPLLLLILLGWWLWNRNSNTGNTEVTTVETETITVAEDTMQTPTVQQQPMTTQRVATEVTLPSGTKINAYQGGIEDEMVRFLNSDEYRNATEDQLKNKWFEFDNINFEFDSGNQLTADSDRQIKNIEAILREYSNAKIKIGAYADNVGDKSVNRPISQERANTIRDILVRDGFSSQITGVEGYGSQFATVDPNASDQERAKDRIIAIRFTK